MFGSKRRQREAEEDAARLASFTAWFGALEQARPAGVNTLTKEILISAGDPYRFLGPNPDPNDIPFMTAKIFGQEWAGRLSRKAYMQDDADARSRSEFWESVAAWL